MPRRDQGGSSAEVAVGRTRTTARYDEIADFYHSVVGDDVGNPAGGALLRLLGDVHGTRILDVACGQGRLSRELARRGASVVGIDLSEKLIKKAAVAESRDPLGIDFRNADISQFRSATLFDAATCHFGLSDIDDLAGALGAVSRVLRPTGILVFSILHPCFPGAGPDAPSSWPPGRGYYAEGWWQADNPGFRGRVGANHRTLSTYLNALVRHGLEPEHFAEPEDTERPELENLPVYLIARCRKVPPPSN